MIFSIFPAVFAMEYCVALWSASRSVSVYRRFLLLFEILLKRSSHNNVANIFEIFIISFNVTLGVLMAYSKMEADGLPGRCVSLSFFFACFD